ncbi:MAG: dienelactone hydrolase family protein [Burkholderiaceae bacterium]|nr:MAG: dienelactone hydrolase family protein [Burkholderiaceae bacterium]
MDNARNELLSLHSGSPVTRRSFVATTLVAGFAPAVLPIAAHAITTDSNGLDAGEVQVPVADGLMPAYLARPTEKKMPPLVLVVQEIFGVHEHIKDICRRLAKAGFAAIAPELYARQGDASKYSDIPSLITEVVNKVPDAQVLADLDACVAYAQGQGIDTGKLGITGFCWGGRIVWLYAAHNPKVAAAVAWYGRLVGEATPLTPQHPLDLATHLRVPVLGLYGGQDGGIPLTTVSQMQDALKHAPGQGAQSRFIVYPDAPHAFHADYRPSYRAAAAQDGWRQMLHWFKRFGVS